MRGDETCGFLRVPASVALEVEVRAPLDLVVASSVQQLERSPAVLPRGGDVGRAFEIAPEAVVVGAGAVLVDEVGRVAQEEDNPPGLGQRVGLVDVQVDIAEDFLIRGQPYEVEEDEIELLPGVVGEPAAVFFRGTEEKRVRIRFFLLKVFEVGGAGEKLFSKSSSPAKLDFRAEMRLPWPNFRNLLQNSIYYGKMNAILRNYSED